MATQAQTYQNLKVRSGNRIAVFFGGVQVGLVKSVECSDDYGLDAATGIGDIHVQEYVPTVARHSLSVSNLALRISSMRQLGIIPENGDAVLKGLVFDMVETDADTGAALRTYRGCSYSSGSTSIQANAIVMQSGQFMCLDVSGTGL